MKKVLIGIISNRKSWPSYFVKSFMELLSYTNQNGVKADINFFNSVEVQMMRNFCCLYALENSYDYVFMLDDDMTYPKDSITKLIKHDKDFVVGSATQRTSPFLPTQYKKYKNSNFKDKSNRVFIESGSNDLIEIGSTGVVGALIKVDRLKKLNYPYFKITYKDDYTVTGSDVYFCNKWKKSKFKIYLDTSVNYSHEISAFSNSFGLETK